jgi:hypothetical protein
MNRVSNIPIPGNLLAKIYHKWLSFKNMTGCAVVVFLNLIKEGYL